MFGITGLALYLIIFIAKVIEVSISTIRIVLITKGEKIIGCIIGFFEVLLWVVVTGTVLTNLMSDPIKIVSYSLGFVCGIFIGSTIEQKLGIGNLIIMTVVEEAEGEALAECLRANNLGVTILQGTGKDSTKDVLMLIVKRKQALNIINIIKEFKKDAIITMSETKPVSSYYGYLKVKK